MELEQLNTGANALLISDEERRLRRKGHEVGYLVTPEAVAPER
jgi:hypothetical protein